MKYIWTVYDCFCSTWLIFDKTYICSNPRKSNQGNLIKEKSFYLTIFSSNLLSSISTKNLLQMKVKCFVSIFILNHWTYLLLLMFIIRLLPLYSPFTHDSIISSQWLVWFFWNIFNDCWRNSKSGTCHHPG